jgi:hypothetical protein
MHPACSMLRSRQRYLRSMHSNHQGQRDQSVAGVTSAAVQEPGRVNHQGILEGPAVRSWAVLGGIRAAAGGSQACSLAVAGHKLAVAARKQMAAEDILRIVLEVGRAAAGHTEQEGSHPGCTAVPDPCLAAVLGSPGMDSLIVVDSP